MSRTKVRTGENYTNGVDSDSSSVYGNILDVALGSDFDGLTDTDVDGEQEQRRVENLVDKSNPTVVAPKVLSVVVIPNQNQRKLALLNSKSEKTNDTSVTPVPSKPKRNHTVKKANVKTGVGPNTLVEMLNKVNVSEAPPKPAPRNLPKRNRSLNSSASDTNENPSKIGRKNHEGAYDPPTGKNFTEAVPKAAKLKICTINKMPTAHELKAIKGLILRKVEDSILEKTFVPTLKDEGFGKDGFYMACPNPRSAEWLYETVANHSIPTIRSKLAVFPEDQILIYEPQETTMRTVLKLPTRQSNDFVLNMLAKYNGNINTEKWRIKGRRPKGVSETTLFLRMDKGSFDKVEAQNGWLNWIVGQVKVEREQQLRKKPKPANLPGTSSATE